MITCPWCGTNYTSFQRNCDNCGGSLPLPPEMAPKPPAERLVAPTPAPRDVPRRALWHIVSSDGWAVSASIFALLGLMFAVVGVPLTVSLVAAFVGLPFLGLGLLFLGGGIAVLVWRYRMAQETVEVLREGEAVLGEILSVVQHYNVRVNGRYPWTLKYDYEVDGRLYGGKVTTLSRPDLSQQPGSPVYVLFMRENPEQSTIYPNPYGYYEL
jgi:membrane protein implicated in regulation of membrane protease activity